MQLHFQAIIQTCGDKQGFQHTRRRRWCVSVCRQTYIQSPEHWGEQWPGLSALHPSKCLMNHISLSPSLLLPFLSQSLSLTLPFYFSLTSSLFVSPAADTTYCFRMRFGRWQRWICITAPPPSGLALQSPNISFALATLSIWCLEFCHLQGPAALSVQWDSLNLIVWITVWMWACMLATWGKHAAALFQLLSGCNGTGTYFWHERNMWKRCLWSPHAQLILFRQQDLAVLETFSTVLLALICCTWLYLLSGRMASLSEHAAFNLLWVHCLHVQLLTLIYIWNSVTLVNTYWSNKDK